MNINDSDLVRALLLPDFDEANNVEEADIVLINTCAIREKPENKVMVRIITLKQEKKIIGVLGCMA